MTTLTVYSPVIKKAIAPPNADNMVRAREE